MTEQEKETLASALGAIAIAISRLEALVIVGGAEAPDEIGRIKGGEPFRPKKQAHDAIETMFDAVESAARLLTRPEK
jgi:hypothetical protein